MPAVNEISVRQYAEQEQIAIHTAYMRLWENKVPGAKRVDGRWVIPVEDVLQRRGNA
jgi:hypothetical protein